MRLTVRLLKHDIFRQAREVWRIKYPPRTRPFVIPKALEEAGIEVVDPLAKIPLKFDLTEHPFSEKVVKEEDKPGYKSDPVFEFTNTVRFADGIPQAQQLSKSLVFEGFPPGVESLINQLNHDRVNDMLQRIMLQSQIWDPTIKPLPKRIDKGNVGWKFGREYGIPDNRAKQTLLTNLLRLANSLVCCRYQSAITDRRLYVKPQFDSYYTLQGSNIVFKGTVDFMMTGNRPLPPFADKLLVEQSMSETLPDIYPILPTIDLKSTHFYEKKDCIGFKNPSEFNHVHTILTSNCEKWQNEYRQARSIVFCLVYAMVQARSRFGADVKHLPEPISVQSVSVGLSDISFVFFQLNTMDFTSTDGIKNFAWLDTGNNLFLKILSKPWLGPEYKEHYYKDFDPTGFHKLLATLQFGLE